MRCTVQVVGDVHANAYALRAALASAEGADAVVLLGDLLTYGADVVEVLDLVLEAQRARGAAVLRGNHDRFYDELVATGRSAYVEKLPDWIRESIDLTMRLLDPGCWREVRFVDEHRIGPLLFAHAGPWEERDDTYLTHTREYERARSLLARRRIPCGVFGHSHRPRLYGPDDLEPRVPPLAASLRLEADAPIVVNAGAVGQPRDQDRAGWSVRLVLSESERELAVSMSRLEYDMAAHVSALRAAPLTSTTLARLVGFHVAA